MGAQQFGRQMPNATKKSPCVAEALSQFAEALEEDAHRNGCQHHGNKRTLQEAHNQFPELDGALASQHNGTGLAEEVDLAHGNQNNEGAGLDVQGGHLAGNQQNRYEHLGNTNSHGGSNLGCVGHLQQGNQLLSPNIPVLAVMAKNHPLAHCESVSLEDPTNTPLVAFEYLKDNNWLEELGIHEPREMLYVFDRGGEIEIISHGRHVGISIGRPFYGVSNDAVVCIPTSDAQARVNQYWLKPQSYVLTATEEQFLRYLAEEE